MPAIYGPPWREVGDPRSVLCADAPRYHACNSDVLVQSRVDGFFRVSSLDLARKVADIVSTRTKQPTAIYSGAIQTCSGRWLWPIQTEVVLAKADDPTTREGFAVIVNDLQNELREYALTHENKAVEEALRTLNRDLGSVPEAKLAALLVLVAGLIENIPKDSQFYARMTRLLARSSVATATASKIRAAGQIGASLTARERDVAQRIGRDALAFVTDEYKRRSVAASERAREIIARGLAQGLGREEIGRDLENALAGTVQGRTANYWRIVASATTSRNRSFGQLSGYRDAGIVGYEWVALMDDRCCEVCRFLNGQVFPVNEGLLRFDRANRERDPEVAINHFAWYRIVGGETGEDGLRRGGDIYVSPRGQGPTERIATVERSGMGINDDRGEHTVHRGVLEGGGTITPPAHGACRCTTVPVFG